MAEVSLQETIARYTANQTPYAIQVPAGLQSPLPTIPSGVPQVSNAAVNDLRDINIANPMPRPFLLCNCPSGGRSGSFRKTRCRSSGTWPPTTKPISPRLFPRRRTSPSPPPSLLLQTMWSSWCRIGASMAANGLPDPKLGCGVPLPHQPPDRRQMRPGDGGDAGIHPCRMAVRNLWGEGLITISMTGHTPGQYFAYGLTDDYAYLSESWRNLQQLVMVLRTTAIGLKGRKRMRGRWLRASPAGASRSTRTSSCRGKPHLVGDVQ